MTRLGAWLLILAGLTGSPAIADDTELERRTLKGLQGVEVVEELSASAGEEACLVSRSKLTSK
jgi:hypothetical protein